MANTEPHLLPPLPSPLEPSSQQTNKIQQPKTTGTNGSTEKTAGRFRVLNQFVDCSMVGLTKSEVLVWLVLYRDTRDGTARTAQSDIARRGGVSVRSVQTAICKLEQRGLLKVVYRGGLNKGPSRYQVLPARIDKPPPTKPAS